MILSRPGKILKRLILLLVVVVLAAGALAYVQASRVPDNYRPAQLGAAERQDAVDQFWGASVADFNNGAQNVVPFQWQIASIDLNRYLASIDAIAAANPSGRSKPGDVDKMMAKAGLSEPAVSFGDGVMTLMVRSTAYSKVMSVDVAVAEDLRIETVATRLGQLPLPDAVGAAALDKLKEVIRSRTEGKDADGVLAELILGINARPMRHIWTLDGKDIRVSSVTITPDGMAIGITPINRGKGGGKAVSTDYPPGFRPPPLPGE